jgi:hypothetical protein
MAHKELSDNDRAMLELVGTTSTLSTLNDLAEAQSAAEDLIVRIQADLKVAEDNLKDIAEKQIPDMMGTLGLTEYKTTKGLYITLKETIRASIPKEKQPEAFGWLREHGHEALITRAITVSFGRGEDKTADALLLSLRVQKLEPSDKTAVNANTLAAFVREQLREGRDIPLETFGVHRQVASKITLPQPKGK